MKQMIKEEYINALLEKLNKAKRSYENAKRDTIEAEGRMITRYDSSKTETAWLADGYLMEVKELESVIERLQSDSVFVNVGDIVYVDVYRKDEYIGKETIEMNENAYLQNKELFVNVLGSYIHDRIRRDGSGDCIEYYIREIDKSAGDKYNGVEINSVIELEADDGFVDYYFLVNNYGGVEIQVEEKEVISVSKNAPVALELLTKKQGDIVNSNGIAFTITNIE